MVGGEIFLVNVKYFSAGAGAAPGPGPEAGDPPAGLSAQQRHRSGGFKHCQVSGGEYLEKFKLQVCHKPKDSRLNVGLEMIVTLININSGMLTQTNLLLVLQILDSYYSYMVSVCSTQFRCV